MNASVVSMKIIIIISILRISLHYGVVIKAIKSKYGKYWTLNLLRNLPQRLLLILPPLYSVY